MRRLSIAGAAAFLLACGGIAQAQVSVVVDDINLVNPRLVNGVLTAPRGTISGTLDGLPFTTDLRRFSLDLTQSQPDGGCAILDLELGPINLSLLGLHVDTSRICLNVTAYDTGLLGSLLCDLSGLDLGGVLDGLLGDGLLGDILGGILGDALTNAQPGGGGGGNGNGNGNGNGGGGGGRICRGDCEILNLVVGPVDLTLLGLEVMLDNCRGGPVQVCVSATAREGILGSLLCSLAGPDLLGLDLAGLLDLGNLAQDLLEDGVLSLADRLQLTQFLAGLLGL